MNEEFQAQKLENQERPKTSTRPHVTRHPMILIRISRLPWPETCLVCFIFELRCTLAAIPSGENLTGVVPSSLLSEEELEKPSVV